MEIKFSLQGGLIYLTTLFFVATFITTVVKSVMERKGAAAEKINFFRIIAQGFWLAGFFIAAASLTFRGFHVQHAPMQNLFEFFLCMAAALWPLSKLSLWKNNIDTTLQDAFLGIIILIPAGFVFGEEIRRLPPALQSPLFVPHVGSYVAGYIMMARAALIAAPMFVAKTGSARLISSDSASRQTTVVGFLLISVGLILGSLWGKLCWGHYWQWDPKEMWSLATWMMYGAYFHLRLKSGLRRPKLVASLLWLGLLFIILTLTWINLSRHFFDGMHNYA